MATATISTRSIQGESLPAAIDRLVNTALLEEGVVGLDDDSFKVTQDTGSNMQVKVGSGTAGDIAVVESDEVQGGVYICEHQNATQTLVVSAADPADDRIDIVVLRVYDDTFDSSGREEADLEIIEGTPAGVPSPPAVPDGAIKLAEILVKAGSTGITNGDITDTRTPARLRPELRADDVAFASAFDPANVVLSTSYQDVGGLTFSPPAHWNTYKIQAEIFVSAGNLNAGDFLQLALRVVGGASSTVAEDNALATNRTIGVYLEVDRLSGNCSITGRVRNITAARGATYSSWCRLIAYRTS